MTPTALIIASVNRTLQVILGAFVMLHLVPLIPLADAAGYTPLHEVRVIDRDIVKLSDVFAGIETRRDQAIGPAPRPGQDMVLNARTLMKLAVAYNVKWEPSTTADQIVLRRDGTAIDAAAQEDAMRTALIKAGAPAPFNLITNTPLAPIILAKDATTDITAQNIALDGATGTFTLDLAPAARPGQSVRVTGRIDPLTEIPVLTRAIAKGSIINADDLTPLEVKTATVKNDIQIDAENIVGLTARRNLMPGRPLKHGDIQIPIAVERGEKVTILYRLGTMELAAQGRALQDGRPGDRVRVVNTNSNKNLEGTVLADHRVIID